MSRFLPLLAIALMAITGFNPAAQAASPNILTLIEVDTASTSLEICQGDEIWQGDEKSSLIVLPTTLVKGDERVITTPAIEKTLTTKPTDQVSFKWWEGHMWEQSRMFQRLFQLWTDEPPANGKLKGHLAA